jgi:hypothetical protein
VRYQFDRGVDGSVLNPEFDMLVDESENSASLGGLFNAALQLSPEHEIGLKNFFNQSASDKALLQQGVVKGSEDQYLRESRIHFTGRNIRSNQLHGKHVFSNLGRAKFEWDYAKSKSPPAQIEIGVADDWDEENVAQLSATMAHVGAFPLEVTEFQGTSYDTLDTTSAAATGSLGEGVYTIQVSSQDGGAGEVLIEVYGVD